MAAPVFQAAGTAQAAGAAAITVPWPAHAVDDIAFLVVESGTDVGLATANGFVRIPDIPQTTTSPITVLDVYWCRATSTSMASPVTNASINHIYGLIVTARGAIATGDPWNVTSGGISNLNNAALSATGDTTTVADCLVFFFAARGTDDAAAQYSGEACAGLTSLTEQHDAGTAIGNGGGLGIWTGVIATAGAYGPLTATLAANATDAFASIALKPPVGGDATVTPAVVPTVTTVPTPTILAASNVTPTVVATVSTVPTPSVIAASNVTPVVVATVTTVPTPTIQAGAVVTPAVVATVTTVPTPTVAVGDTVVMPATVATTTTVPTPTINAGAVVTPATVAAVTTVPNPTVAGEGIGNPATVAVVSTVPTPLIQAGAVATPAVVAATTTVPTPLVAASATVTPATVATTTTVPTPTAQGAVTVLPVTVAAVTTVPTPSIVAAATVTPATVATVMTVPTPTIISGPVVTIPLPASATISDDNNSGTIRDRSRVAVLSSANRTGTISP